MESVDAELGCIDRFKSAIFGGKEDGLPADPLRVGRSRRDVWTLFGVELPLVAYEDLRADQREA